MAVPDDTCAQCCTCPTPTTQWDSRSASKAKAGYPAFDASTNRIFRTLTIGGASDRNSGCPAAVNLSRLEYSGSATVEFDGSCTTTAVRDFYVSGVLSSTISLSCFIASPPSVLGAGPQVTYAPTTLNETQRYWILDWCQSLISGDEFYYDSVTGDLSDEYTTTELIANVVAALPAYPDTWAGTPGSFRNLSTDELSIAIREDRYRLIFPVPLVGSGACYRLEWVERFIAEAGVALDSADIVTRGVYRPTVSITGDGTGALAVAVMAADGTVDFFRVLNPGDGNYTTITITCQAAINGGTTATATGVLAGGRLASITKTGAGDYLPTGAFTGGGGSGATITFTLDETGGLATCPLGSGGSAYTSAPTLTITPKVSGSLAARVDLHLGTETARCGVWDGIVPSGYDPGDNTTWPILGDGTNPYFELPVPTADGTTLLANILAACDCSACP